MYYNPTATILFMEQNNISKQILVEILQNKKSFKNAYEQKCFIIGMTHILTVQDAPETFRDPATTSRLLQEILSMLEKIQKREAKDASKKATKQIHADNDESSEDSLDMDDDETSSEEDDDTLNENGKRSRGNSGTAEEMMDDEGKEEKKDGADVGFG